MPEPRRDQSATWGGLGCPPMQPNEKPHRLRQQMRPCVPCAPVGTSPAPLAVRHARTRFVPLLPVIRRRHRVGHHRAPANAIRHDLEASARCELPLRRVSDRATGRGPARGEAGTEAPRLRAIQHTGFPRTPPGSSRACHIPERCTFRRALVAHESSTPRTPSPRTRARAPWAWHPRPRTRASTRPSRATRLPNASSTASFHAIPSKEEAHEFGFPPPQNWKYRNGTASADAASRIAQATMNNVVP
jgi:hypothetical protein